MVGYIVAIIVAFMAFYIILNGIGSESFAEELMSLGTICTLLVFFTVSLANKINIHLG